MCSFRAADLRSVRQLSHRLEVDYPTIVSQSLTLLYRQSCAANTTSHAYPSKRIICRIGSNTPLPTSPCFQIPLTFWSVPVKSDQIQQPPDFSQGGGVVACQWIFSVPGIGSERTKTHLFVVKAKLIYFCCQVVRKVQIRVFKVLGQFECYVTNVRRSKDMCLGHTFEES